MDLVRSSLGIPERLLSNPPTWKLSKWAVSLWFAHTTPQKGTLSLKKKHLRDPVASLRLMFAKKMWESTASAKRRPLPGIQQVFAARFSDTQTPDDWSHCWSVAPSPATRVTWKRSTRLNTFAARLPQLSQHSGIQELHIEL